MIPSGAWAGLGMLAENMRQRLAERSGRWAGSEEALVDEGVHEAALHKVATMRAVPGEDLTVLSVESGTKPTTIVQIGAPDAKTYRVEVIDRGRVRLTRVSKITEGGPAT